MLVSSALCLGLKAASRSGSASCLWLTESRSGMLPALSRDGRGGGRGGSLTPPEPRRSVMLEVGGYSLPLQYGAMVTLWGFAERGRPRYRFLVSVILRVVVVVVAETVAWGGWESIDSRKALVVV